MTTRLTTRGTTRSTTRSTTPGAVSKITSIAFVGDSTTAEAGNAGIQPYGMSGTSTSIAAAWANAVSWALGKDIPIILDTTASPSLVTFARSGVKSDHVLATQIPAILESETLPSHVVWKIGTNDVSQSYPIADSEDNIRDGIALLKAAGIKSIITTINPRREGDGNEEGVAEFNDLLETIAAETGSFFVDSRPLLESAPGTEFLGCLYDGVHQWQMTSYAMAADFVNQVGSRFSPSLVDPFDLGSLLHTHANITSTPPAGLTTSQTTVAREDGIAGDWYRCAVTSSPSISIGTGNSGVAYTPVSPQTNETIAIYHRTNVYSNNFSNGGSPRIIVAETDNGRKFIEVRSETTGSTATTTAAQVVAAINAHPEASLLVTASAVGDGTGVMASGSGWPVWSLLLANAATNPAEGLWVRAICEFHNRDQIREVGQLRLWRTTPSSTSLRTLPTSLTASTILLPSRRWVIATPWHQIGSGESGWRAQMNFGAEKGTVDIGRFGVQVYNG
jgi:lysophospholipase L1-like esterase